MLIIYLVGKLILYSFWCYVGMRLFQSPRLFTVAAVSPITSTVTDNLEHSSVAASAKQALGLGLFRLAIGVVFGAIAILAAGLVVDGATNSFDQKLLAYGLFLVPVRSLEWWITSKVIGKTSASASVILWVLGGVVLSCLADIPTSFAVVDMLSGLC